jgi:hypothetical protein
VFESNEIHLFGIFFLVFFSYSCENQLGFHYADVNHQDAAPARRGEGRRAEGPPQLPAVSSP